MKYKYIICGKSGVGKSTVVNAINQQYGLKKIMLYTTRPSRNTNHDGKIHIQQSQFNALDKLVEFTFNGYYYAITHKQFNHGDIFDMAPSGIIQLLAHENYCKHIKVICIQIDEETRKQRLINRGEDTSFIVARNIFEIDEFRKLKNIVDFYVENYDLQQCVNEILSIIDNFESSSIEG